MELGFDVYLAIMTSVEFVLLLFLVLVGNRRVSRVLEEIEKLKK